MELNGIKIYRATKNDKREIKSKNKKIGCKIMERRSKQ